MIFLKILRGSKKVWMETLLYKQIQTNTSMMSPQMWKTPSQYGTTLILKSADYSNMYWTEFCANPVDISSPLIVTCLADIAHTIHSTNAWILFVEVACDLSCQTNALICSVNFQLMFCKEGWGHKWWGGLVSRIFFSSKCEFGFSRPCIWVEHSPKRVPSLVNTPLIL